MAPTSFLPSPPPTESRHPQQTGSSQPGGVLGISHREWPTLTLYRDAPANFNGLATELLRSVAAVALVAPEPTKPGRLAKAWQLHGGCGSLLLDRADRGVSRFRPSREATVALFAGCSPQVTALRFALTPEPGHADRWRLLPL